jgi:hypothetical protein
MKISVALTMYVMEFQVIFWHLLRGIREGGTHESRCVSPGFQNMKQEPLIVDWKLWSCT